MTRTQFVQLAGIAGTLAGLSMVAEIIRARSLPLWASSDDSTGALWFLGSATLVVLGIIGNAHAAPRSAPRSSPFALASVGLAVLSVPIMLFGVAINWSLLLIGTWVLLISCMLGALHAIVARPASRISAILLVLSAPVVPFMNTLDDRIWLLLPFALAWIFFGCSLAMWRGTTGTHPAVN